MPCRCYPRPRMPGVMYLESGAGPPFLQNRDYATSAHWHHLFTVPASAASRPAADDSDDNDVDDKSDERERHVRTDLRHDGRRYLLRETHFALPYFSWRIFVTPHVVALSYRLQINIPCACTALFVHPFLLSFLPPAARRSPSRVVTRGTRWHHVPRHYARRRRTLPSSSHDVTRRKSAAVDKLA